MIMSNKRMGGSQNESLRDIKKTMAGRTTTKAINL